ncbi:MAG: hypothetical protein SR1Q7_12545 [Quinella sp. 1Q7]|nr:hypothetical protein [Quinella sp. 1Q7]
MSSSLINRTNQEFPAQVIDLGFLRWEAITLAEIFSDSTRGNFPKTPDDLAAWLKSVASCINNDEQLQNWRTIA